jgi:hypothetical protein
MLLTREDQLELLASARGDARIVVVRRRHEVESVDDTLAGFLRCPPLADRCRTSTTRPTIQPSSSGSSYVIVSRSLSLAATTYAAARPVYSDL